jgi:PqqD family protein of HPr-rel-A system
LQLKALPAEKYCWVELHDSAAVFVRETGDTHFLSGIAASLFSLLKTRAHDREHIAAIARSRLGLDQEKTNKALNDLLDIGILVQTCH